MSQVALALRFARREMRLRLAGFRIFFACLALGVMAIAGVGSLSQAFLTGLAEQGRTLLGGDVVVHLVHREARDDELKYMNARGRVSEILSMRAMAYALKNGTEAERQLVELKAVDNAYPFFGAVSLSPEQKLSDALACKNSICGAVAEITLLDRLNLKPGGLVRIGTQTFRLSAVLNGEPDRISGGFSLGPHVIMSNEALRRTGLVTLGSLIDYNYRIVLPASGDPKQFKAGATAAFPDAGWEIRDRSDAAPGIRRFVEQVTMFLTLVGLTALAVGGVGAGQAVSAFLDRKREEIATLKSLGADGPLIFLIFFFQVMAIAAVAVGTGLILGAALPFGIEYLYGSDIPAPARFALYAQPLLFAAAFGLLSAVAFAIPPLSRARLIPPASLFRDLVAPANARGALPYLAGAAVAGAAIIGLALLLAAAPVFAAEFLAGVAIGLAALRLIAEALRWTLRRLPRPRNTALRLAFANLTRPGSATTGVVTALGLGLTLLATVSLLNNTIAAQVKGRLPALAPSFFFVDIQPDEAAAFDAAVHRFKSAEDFRRTPMIRGRIVSLRGIAAKDARVAPAARWALSGDRGITYAAAPPEGTVITAGQWWPADYAGPMQISFDEDLAQGMGLRLGDKMVLNVLGREIEGTVTSFRKVDFTTGQQNFIIVVSPEPIIHAPHSFLATVRVDPRDEEPLYRAITDAFPNISTVRVKDAIAQVDTMFQELSDGVRAASLLTILSGLLVLAGAIAAGGRGRLYDATVLKVLGATRARIALVYILEYGVTGVLTGFLALGTGALAAGIICREVLQVPLTFDLGVALMTVAGGGVATLLFGLIGALSALSARPAAQLRAP
ncbi:MAG: FtsX-like permease family protein [Alphaproteobacteria bacterium]|nr:FtsX-like permease family protein [Alphaproteobacteria bacterium]MBL6939727.1 FtsX-like permease family protein [Alphaproteobacteria bacterium]MBL7096951.1 FtsX-like permease family protein [Alphaproteobacteria bacterium]